MNLILWSPDKIQLTKIYGTPLATI